MESIIRNVRDINTGERRSLEHLLGKHLEENQQLIIQIVTPAAVPEKNEHAPAASSEVIPDCCNFYAGLSDSEVAEIESAILQRSLSRSFE